MDSTFARQAGPRRFLSCVVALSLGLAACGGETAPASTDSSESPAASTEAERIVDKYTSFRLDADLSGLSESERRMIPLLIAASEAMDEVFWMQAYGDREALLSGLEGAERQAVEINYGPWDRLDGNRLLVTSRLSIVI